MISFNGIPVSVLTPGTYAEFNDVRASQSLAPWSTCILLMGQAPVNANHAPHLRPVRINTAQDAVNAYGAASMLSKMCAAALAVNTTTPLWAMSVGDNPAGTAAQYTDTFTASPTAAGTLARYIAGTAYEIAVTAGESIASMATALAAAVNADPGCPVSAVAAAGIVTYTCNWAGETGNWIDFRVNLNVADQTPPGLVLANAQTVQGAGNPVVTPLLAAMGATQYNDIAFPWTDVTSLEALATEMANRRGPMEMIEGVAYASVKGSLGQLEAFGPNSGQNSPDISISECTGPSTPWERCAREAALINFYTSIDPPRPLQTLVLTGDFTPAPNEIFLQQERNALLADAISTHTVDAGGNLLLERPITTYLANAQGVPDQSYMDVTTMKTLAYLRYSFRARIAQKYPRCKLADNGTIISPGQAMVTPNTLLAELIALARDWEAAGLVNDVDEWKSLFVVQRDASDNSRVDMIVPPNIVSGLRVVAASFQFAF